MRIRAVVPLYPPKSLVGSWITTHEFLSHMVRRGHHVGVTAYMSRAPAHWHDGILIDRPPVPAAEQADVVVGHVGDDGSASFVARRLGVPLVYMAHGGATAEIRAKLAGCDLVVFNSQALADEIRWDGPSVVAHPPVRAEDYATTPGDRVAQINLSAAKGGETFWRLVAALPDVEFLAVRGGYGHQLLWSGHRNVYLQRPTPDVVRAVYGRSRVLLMPSEHETWGRVALEAAASGIPTIAHPHPGVVEALGDAALYADRDDLDAWVEAIGVLQDPAVWASASALALEQSRAIDPDEQLWRFESAVMEVAACASCS